MNYKILGENKQKDFLFEIFHNRGFNSMEQILKYINTTDFDIEPATNLDNIVPGVQLLKKHLDKNDKIVIVVDCDVDGFVSASILYNFLKRIDDNYDIQYILHESKQHGLSNDLYEDVYNNEYKLVILPDGGSNDYEQHKKLKMLGIDVLVLDHHEAPYYSKDAIVINNQLSANYSNKSLSGAGVVWHFIDFYNKIYNTNISTDDFLDLVALGNVSDIMDLRSIETKHLVMKGLKNINNPFFSTACKKQEYSLKNKITPEGVAWYIGPYINAMVRVGTREDKERLFLSMIEKYGHLLVESSKRGSKPGELEDFQEQAFRLCSNARNKQNSLVDAGMEYVKQKIQEQNLTKNKVLIITIPQDKIVPEIVGLVANKIASEYQQPTLILRENENTFAGSGRNFNYSPLEDFRGFLDESGLAVLAQG